MIIGVHEFNEHDNLHFSGHFYFGGNFKCFLVLSIGITGGKIDLTHDKKTIQFYIKKTYTILYDIGVLGLNELDNVHFDLAIILTVFC